jgi:hypothetical protein
MMDGGNIIYDLLLWRWGRGVEEAWDERMIHEWIDEEKLWEDAKSELVWEKENEYNFVYSLSKFLGISWSQIGFFVSF